MHSALWRQLLLMHYSNGEMMLQSKFSSKASIKHAVFSKWSHDAYHSISTTCEAQNIHSYH